MLRDVCLEKTADGKQIKIQRESGATFTDIGKTIDDVAKNYKVNEIFSVGGTQVTMDNMDVEEIKRKRGITSTKNKNGDNVYHNE